MILRFREPEGNFTSSDAWSITTTTNCTFEIRGQALRYKVGDSANNEYPFVRPNITVTGDFDLIMSYVGLDANWAPNTQGVELFIYSATQGTSFAYLRAMYDSGYKFYLDSLIDSVSQGAQSKTRTKATSGYLRIVRSGSNLTFYTKEGNATSWTNQHTLTWVNHETHIRLAYQTGVTSTNPRGAAVTSFEIAAGTLNSAKQASGTVKEGTANVARKVRVYNRDNGELLAETTSAADGTFSFTDLVGTGERYFVFLDDDAGDDYNAVIYDRVQPASA